MAYPSKIERHCAWLDQRFNAWVRSLAAKSVTELQADLAAIEERIARAPKRHTRRIDSMESHTRVLRAVIAERTAQ
jgi:hypothetical protein